jgi:lambda family phage portal protein
MKSGWLDRVAGWIAPQWAFRRLRARMATELLIRHYEGAAATRRTQGWYRSLSDANAANGPSLSRLRDIARDLVRNNPYAESIVATIVDHTVGWGITPTVQHEAWKRWAESRQIDAEGRHDLAGLIKLAMGTIVVSGEVLVRRHVRRVEDGLALPFQLQVLEPDFLDILKDYALPDGGRIIQGVEFNARGQRVAYWLYPEHPGAFSGRATFRQSQRVPASDVLHVFKPGRPGQVRGVSWFAPVLVRFKDFDELEDAQLMKQKVAALLAVITTDPDGQGLPIGTTDPATPAVDMLEPGMILNATSGRQVTVVAPPSVSGYPEYSRTIQRAIATGVGVSYEDLTGDYTNLPFSAARMARLRHWARVQDWRWRILVPQLLDPLWSWAMEFAEILGLPIIESTDWTAPPLPMLEPDVEGLAAMRNIRAGIRTPSETLREQGYDPETFWKEMAADWKRIDELGLVLDSDPRKMTQAGQAQPAPSIAD